MASSRPYRILVFGHSFIHRLETCVLQDGLNAYFDGPWPNLRISPQLAEVFFYGVGGLTLGRAREHYGAINDFSPDCVVVQLGENDLDSPLGVSNPEQVAMDIFWFAKRLIEQTTARKVVVCQLFPRPTPRIATYGGSLRALNDFMKIVLDGSPSVHYFPLRGIFGQNQVVFGRDGVHMNEYGNYIFAKIVWWAVLRAVRLLKE